MSDDTNNRKDERRSGGQNQGAGECEEKCSIKNMTKAERRELQVGGKLHLTRSGG